MFSHWEFAWLALALPIIGTALVYGHKLRLQAKRVYGTEKLLERFSKKQHSKMDWIHPAGIFAAAVLLVIAAMGPVMNAKPERVPDGSVQAVVVLDVSKSMAAEDYREFMPADAGPKPDLNQPWGSRLQMGKYQIRKIMDSIKGNQMGLVNYTENGFSQSDLTSDFNALRFVVDKWVSLGNAPGYGSHYENGLREALDTFKRDEDPRKKKVIIMISDGGFDGKQEGLEKVVADLNAQNVQLVIIGVGMPGENSIPEYKDGKLTGYLTVDGKVVTTSYEEDHLRQLAAMTHGTYHHVDTSAGQQTPAIDFSKEIGGSRTELHGTPLFPYFGGTALAIVVILSIVGLRKRG
jgi:hypothetical protein